MLTWDDRFSVKVTVIDEQHKQLFGSARRFSEAMQRNESREAFAELLGFLIEYGKMHFQTEEAIFLQCGYEAAASHIEQHQLFLDIVQGFKLRFESDDLIVAAEVVHFLENCLVEHVTTSDQRYVPCLAAQGLTKPSS